MNGQEENTNLIYSYTRQQAIDDGVFIDVSDMAKEAGFSVPVAVTSNLWHRHIVPSESAKSYGQDCKGRLFDVFWMLYGRISGTKQNERLVTFKVIFADGPHPRDRQIVELWAVCEDDGRGKPALNIMLPADY